MFGTTFWATKSSGVISSEDKLGSMTKWSGDWGESVSGTPTPSTSTSELARREFDQIEQESSPHGVGSCWSQGQVDSGESEELEESYVATNRGTL